MPDLTSVYFKYYSFAKQLIKSNNMHMKRLAFISFLIITSCSSTPPIPEEQDFLLQSDQIAQIEKKDQTIIHSCVETVRSQSVGVREYYRDLIARNGWDCVKYAKEIAAEA